jgi:hypothetical protein
MTCCVGMAQYKGNIRRNQIKYNVEQGAHKERTFGKRHHMKPKGSHGLKNRDVKE